MRPHLALALAGTLVAGLAAAEPLDVRFYGYAYDLETRRYLYTEVHEQRLADDRWLSGTITYVAPDGSLLGRKTLDFSAHPFVPLYRLDLVQEGYSEGISAIADAVTVWRLDPDWKQPKTAQIRRREPMAGDSGIHAYIRERFADLVRGDTVRFRIAVAGSLDYFSFRARRIGETTFEGEPTVRIRMEPDTLLRFLVDPMILTYEPRQRRLLEYRGISNVHDPATGRAYNVYITYPSERPADAPPLPDRY